MKNEHRKIPKLKHEYDAVSIPTVTPRYCTKKIEKCSVEHKKKQRKKKYFKISELIPKEHDILLLALRRHFIISTKTCKK